MAVFYAFFWFVAAIAQAAAVNGIKDATNVHTITKSLVLCSGTHKCNGFETAKYATLTVSIVSILLFGSCSEVLKIWHGASQWHRDYIYHISMGLPTCDHSF